MGLKCVWLIWEQRSDGKFVYDVVNSEEEARRIAEADSRLFYYPTLSKWKKGERIGG